MRLPLLKAKELLASKAPKDELNYRLNRVCERLLLHGKFSGSLQRIIIAARYGQIALPTIFRTIEGVQVDGRVYDLANRWWDYLAGKGEAWGSAYPIVKDLGDGFATMSDLPVGGQDYSAPQVELVGGGGTGAKANVVVRDGIIIGANITEAGTGYTTAPAVVITDPKGTGATLVTLLAGDRVAQIFIVSGGNLVANLPGSDPLTMVVEGQDYMGIPSSITFTGNGNVTLANPFNVITRVSTGQIPVTTTLIHIAANGNGTYLVILAPQFEEAFYRRYKVDDLILRPMVYVKALVKIRFIEFTKDSDILPFFNVTALGLGLDAYQAESEGDKSLAKQFWDDAVDMLNLELGDTKANAEGPNIRFYYPGRTVPKLRSHF